MSNLDSIDDFYSENMDGDYCSTLYRTLNPFISKKSPAAAYLFASVFEFALLSFFITLILRKQYYIHIKHNLSKAKSILLPYYDHMMYYYICITVIKLIFALIQYFDHTVSTFHADSSSFWMMSTGVLVVAGMMVIEFFILFLLMQTSIGKNAFKRSIYASLFMCVCTIILLYIKQYIAKYHTNVIYFCLSSIAIHSIIVCTALVVFIYARYCSPISLNCLKTFQKKKPRKRMKILFRLRLLSIYISLILTLNGIMILSYILLIVSIDTFCIIQLNYYLYHISFPLVSFYIIKKDSDFWRLLLSEWQTSPIHQSPQLLETRLKNNFIQKSKLLLCCIHNKQNKDIIKRASYVQFDEEKENINDGNRIKHQNRSISFYKPLLDILSVDVPMIDFCQLHEISDPIAVGSTAMVYKARYMNEDVAIKYFMFDELSLLEISEFFRETLLLNGIEHEQCRNIVQFKGACIRPPELCLVYEYCSGGDLTHLLMPHLFHNSFKQQKYYDIRMYEMHLQAIKFETRLQMLKDIADGMFVLHEHDIIHRDLKTANILVHYCSREKRLIAKVCDFGSARKVSFPNSPSFSSKSQSAGFFSSFALSSHLYSDDNLINISDEPDVECALSEYNAEIDEDTDLLLTTQVGTLAFMAPEIISYIDINGLSGAWIPSKSNEMKSNNELTEDLLNAGMVEENSTNVYDKYVDVYSFAIILWEVGCLQKIYGDMNVRTICNMVSRGKRMKIPTYEQSQELENGFFEVRKSEYYTFISLLNNCWTQNPMNRPMFFQISQILNDILVQQKKYAS